MTALRQPTEHDTADRSNVVRMPLPAELAAVAQRMLADAERTRISGPAGHAVSYRISLPLIHRRYYLAFFIGSEKRNLGRVSAEAQRKSWLHTTVSLSAVLMFLSTLFMSTLATAYLLKSMVGIDLFDDHFILHGLFFR